MNALHKARAAGNIQRKQEVVETIVRDQTKNRA